MRRLGLLTIALAVLAAVVIPSGSPVNAAAGRAARVPALTVSHAVSGLDIPWDVKVLPGNRLLVDERSNKRLIVVAGGTKRVLAGFAASRVWASGETGVMGLAVDPSFAQNRRIYTCQGWIKANGGHDIRVIAWTMNAAYTRVKLVRAPSRVISSRQPPCRPELVGKP
jgi:glucose/arabinose dehydrogenase